MIAVVRRVIPRRERRVRDSRRADDDLPLAENTRRENGLRLDQLMAALRPLVQMPQWSALTITELNPDHGEADGSTVRRFVDALADVLTRQ